MNKIRKIVLSLMIIIGLNLCFCEEYHLKTVVENMDPMVTKFKSSVAIWDLLSKMFQYERFITVNIEEFIKKENVWFNNFLKAFQIRVGLPVTVIETSERWKQTMDHRQMHKYQQNSNTSYIFIMDMRLYSIFLEKAQMSSITWDARANFVVMTSIDSLLKLHNTFREMWKIYGINKIIAIDMTSENIVAYNCFKDRIKVFNDSNIEQILQYHRLKYGLEGYPIKVAMYESQPISIDIPNSTKFKGLEQMLIDTLKHSLNFSVKMYKINESEHGLYGPMPSIFKKLKNREIDIAANMHFIVGHTSESDAFEYTSPFFTERLHFVVPKAKKIPLWLNMYLVFNTEMWISMAWLFGLFVVLWLCILKFGQRQRIREHIGPVIINVLLLFGGSSIPMRMTTYSKRLLCICGSIFAIIMVNCFSGDLFRRFSKDAYYPDINSFEQLEASGLHVKYGTWIGDKVLNNSNNPSMMKLLGKANYVNNLSIAFNLTNGVLDHAVLTRVTRAKYENAKSLIENNGTTLFHRINEPVAIISMAYIVTRGWVFLKPFNSCLNKILEAGLIQKWYYDSFFNQSLWMQRLERSSSDYTPRAFTLSDLRLAWIVLGVGLTISSLVFLIELAWHFRTSKRARRALRLS